MQPGAQPRIVGVDVARALALAGMVAAHMIQPVPGEGNAVDPWFQLVAGRSSALFALLAGVSIVLSTSRFSPPAALSLRAGARRALAVRAGLVALIGLLLGLVSVGVAVILAYYGLLFLCALPVLRWRARSLALLTLGWGLASPLVSALLRPALPEPTLQIPNPLSLVDPAGLTLELLVTGYYPVLTWATYLFAGMAIGRLRLRNAVVAQRLLLSGLLLGVAALGVSARLTRSPHVREVLRATFDGTEADPMTRPALHSELTQGFFGTTPTGSLWWLGVWSPHSGSIVDLAHTTGCAVAVLGLALLVAAALPGTGRRALGIIAGGGSMTLTLYVVHVLLLAAPEELTLTQYVSFHLVVLGGLGALFVAARARGPLELMVSQVAQQNETHTSPPTDRQPGFRLD